MKRIIIEAPGMYADHHVTEVRRIVLALPGVEDVTASSAFRVIELSIDSKKIKEDVIREALGAAGYLREIPMVAETGAAKDNRAFPRHSKVVQQAGDAVSFGQDIPSAGLPALSCPGMGVIKMED